jgi:hypothetical protein
MNEAVWSTNLTPLERAFHDQVMKETDFVRREYNYPATHFRQMVANNPKGAVGVAHKLLATDKWHDGFTKMWEIGRLDLTIEARAVDDQYRELFTDEERARAGKKLKDLGFGVPGGA